MLFSGTSFAVLQEQQSQLKSVKCNFDVGIGYEHMTHS